MRSIVLTVLLWLSVSVAYAQSCTQASPCEQGAAFSGAVQASHDQVAYSCSRSGCPPNVWIAQAPTGPVHHSGTADPLYYYQCGVKTGAGSSVGCNDVQSRWFYKKSTSCAGRSDMLNVRYDGGGSMCSGGCAYAPVLGAGESGSYRTTKVKGATGGSYDVTRADRMAPTGGTCTVSQETPDQFTGEDQCVQHDTLTQCVTKDGKICTQASTGKQFCWSPGENGIKTSGNEAASKIPDGKDAKTPPVPPKNGGEWEKVGETSISITDTNKNGSSTSNSTVNNYNSNYGTSGSGASGNGANGESNGGSGSGSGSGGDGEGEGGDGGGAGAPGEGVGDLYEGNGKTVSSVFTEFKSRVGESPLIAAINGFFSVNVGGACPAFSVQASTYWDAMTFDAHCGGDLNAALRAIGWVLMAIAALAAAYWALS